LNKRQAKKAIKKAGGYMKILAPYLCHHDIEALFDKYPMARITWAPGRTIKGGKLID
jgi:hypothetical protein